MAARPCIPSSSSMTAMSYFTRQSNIRCKWCINSCDKYCINSLPRTVQLLSDNGHLIIYTINLQYIVNNLKERLFIPLYKEMFKFKHCPCGESHNILICPYAICKICRIKGHDSIICPNANHPD